MTPEETRQAAAVMSAYVAGKRIEFHRIGDPSLPWEKISTPLWNWQAYEYRVAPERWAGKIWVHPDGSYMTPATAMGENRMAAAGWRLIEAKEVEP